MCLSDLYNTKYLNYASAIANHQLLNSYMHYNLKQQQQQQQQQ